MAMTIEKLKKVIDMAKRGTTEGERANAKRIAEKACVELGISYQDALFGKFGNHTTHKSENSDFSYPWRFYEDISYATAWNSRQRQENEDIASAIHKMYEETLRKQRQQTQDHMNGFWEQAQKQNKREAIYTDKFGEKWKGIEIESLSKERRYKLFGLDPLI